MAGPRVAVVGAGAWGTTLARLIARTEPVTLLCHSPETAARIAETHRNEARLPGIDLPATLFATADVAVLREATDLVIFATPSAHLRSAVAGAAPFLAPEADLLSVVKGLERGTNLRMSEVIGEGASVPIDRIAALSGPNLAAEIARNIVAIAAGAADGLGFGDNGKAGLLTRGLAEMTRLGMVAGANPLTFAGLAGMGDLIATCGSPLSRNHRLGEELARGRRWSEIEATLPGTAEGAYTVQAALALAERLGVEMPIAREVERALFEGKSVQRCLVDLLAREPKDELADYGRWIAQLGGRSG
ncbi:MAG: NAD(P)H-dependent glycerol-3-phosphate dehydrogenase [Chloroflexota bacterium]